MSRAPRRRVDLCTHRPALVLVPSPLAGPMCVSPGPSFRHPRVHPETFCVAQLRHFARSEYNSNQHG
eukprot:3992182-Prymnesium_polylepis.2